MDKKLTPENIEQGVNELIDFVDLMLIPRYGEKTTAAIVTEFAIATPRTVLAMASASEPEAYTALRGYLVDLLEKTAKQIEGQEAIDIVKAKQEFELLFTPITSRIQ